MKAKPLYSRIFKFKNPVVDFYCPLCRTERSLLTHSKLTSKHYLQIFITSSCLILASFPAMQFRSFIWFFIVWILTEAMVKIFFRQQIPCPHCGFDATWYRRDVKVAKKLVEEFWKKAQNQNPSKNNKEA